MKKKYVLVTALGILTFAADESLKTDLYNIETMQQNKAVIISHDNLNNKYKEKTFSYFEILTPAQAKFLEKEIINYFSKNHWGDYDYTSHSFKNIENILRKKAHLEVQSNLNKDLNIDWKKINLLYYNFFTNNALSLQLKNCKTIRGIAEEFENPSNLELIKNTNNEEKKILSKENELRLLCTCYEKTMKNLYDNFPLTIQNV